MVAVTRLAHAEMALVMGDDVEPHDDLIERLRRADPAAVVEVYRAHQVQVRKLASRVVGDPDIAEDLVHEVFLDLPRMIRNYREESTLGSFLLGCVSNRARHYVRAAARRRKTIERHANEPINPSRGPDAALDDRRLASALTRALDALSVAHRVAFVLCEIEGRTAVEAAQILDVPEATVRTRLFHARQRLRERLSEEGWR
ncbi:MAG: polymerase sigma factor [Myxococcales bacterium]|nr:polymerase sigma factor [Myxococcales bacterium]